VSLLGEGSSLTIAGAHTLAAALADRPADYAAAFGRYEAVRSDGGVF
jgi:2-polyprenyl-6-methoxyphenol hydroxylase-like FAD-dependent oxidoreductase